MPDLGSNPDRLDESSIKKSAIVPLEVTFSSVMTALEKGFPLARPVHRNPRLSSFQIRPVPVEIAFKSILSGRQVENKSLQVPQHVLLQSQVPQSYGIQPFRSILIHTIALLVESNDPLTVRQAVPGVDERFHPVVQNRLHSSEVGRAGVRQRRGNLGARHLVTNRESLDKCLVPHVEHSSFPHDSLLGGFREVGRADDRHQPILERGTEKESAGPRQRYDLVLIAVPDCFLARSAGHFERCFEGFHVAHMRAMAFLALQGIPPPRD